MITMVIGSSKELVINLLDSAKVVLDPALCSKIRIELYPEKETNKILKQYSTIVETGFESASIVGTDIIVFLDSADTTTFPQGVIAIRIWPFYTDVSYVSGFKVEPASGGALNMKP